MKYLDILILSFYAQTVFLAISIYNKVSRQKSNLKRFFSETGYPFEVRFAVIAIMFLLFILEVLYLFPLVSLLYSLLTLDIIIILGFYVLLLVGLQYYKQIKHLSIMGKVTIVMSFTVLKDTEGYDVNVDADINDLLNEQLLEYMSSEVKFSDILSLIEEDLKICLTKENIIDIAENMLANLIIHRDNDGTRDSQKTLDIFIKNFNERNDVMPGYIFKDEPNSVVPPDYPELPEEMIARCKSSNPMAPQEVFITPPKPLETIIPTESPINVNTNNLLEVDPHIEITDHTWMIMGVLSIVVVVGLSIGMYYLKPIKIHDTNAEITPPPIDINPSSSIAEELHSVIPLTNFPKEVVIICLLLLTSILFYSLKKYKQKYLK